MNLGRKIEPPKPEPAPEWKRCADGRFEANAQGQLRTVIPIPPPEHIDVSAFYLRF